MPTNDHDKNAAETMQQIDKLIDGFDTAMLVTEALSGELRARPMNIAGNEEGALLYFLTRADDEKLQEILKRNQVVVSLSDDQRYVSISGTARIETDQVLIDKYWTPDARLWFPEGTEDPDITLLVFEPTYAESWDRSGLKQLELWWEAGKALLESRKLDDDSLAGHHEARVGSKPD